MLDRLVQSTIQRLKHDTTYHLDQNVTGYVLLQVLAFRGVAFLRGWFWRFRLKKVAGALFVGRQIVIRHSQFISVGSGVILEDYVFMDALSQKGIQLGNNVTIAKFSTIQCTGVIRNLGVGVTIGNNSAIGAYSFLGGQGGIQIGDNVIMGPRVNFHSENHIYQDLNVPIRLQGETRQGITVDDNCWIGAGSVILDGVHIHSGCVVAAGSVVTHDIPPNSIIAGVPGRIIKRRDDVE